MPGGARLGKRYTSMNGDGQVEKKLLVNGKEIPASLPSPSSPDHALSMDPEELLLAPLRHICETTRAETRLKLAEAFNYWLRIPDDVMGLIGETTELLHNGSLLIDDIKDNSSLRRGVPAAHIVFGVPQTMTTANYTFVLLLKKVTELGRPEAVPILAEHLGTLLRGDSREISWTDTGHCPTLEEYRTMVIEKRGGLFELIVRLMQLFSENKSDFKPLIEEFGIYYQIRNDYINLCSTEYQEKNGYCSDLTEGSFTYPIIHAIRADPRDRRVINILRRKTSDVTIKRFCVSILDKNDSFQYTRSALTDLDSKIREYIDFNGGNPHFSTIMDALKRAYTT